MIRLRGFYLSISTVRRCVTPHYDYECEDCGDLEIFHSIMDDAHTVCPECGKNGLVRQVSTGVAFIMKGKQVNQYSDVIGAKYWRDADGNRHKVTPADGLSSSPTVSSKRKRTDKQVAALKKKQRPVLRDDRIVESYQRLGKTAHKRERKFKEQ